MDNYITGFDSENLNDITKMLTNPKEFKYKHNVIKQPKMLELWGMYFYEILPMKYNAVKSSSKQVNNTYSVELTKDQGETLIHILGED